MKVLFISNLYPDQTEPGRGLPNARLLRRLAAVDEVRVMAPRPVWPLFPGRRRRPLGEDEAVAPIFPPVWYVPKMGSRVNPWLMRQCLSSYVMTLHRRWPFEVILAAWLYPDACAVQPLAEALKVPLLAIAQGSDVHQYLQHPVRRRLIQHHLGRASWIIARSQSLAQALKEAGFLAARTRVIYNGVDTQRFHPGDGKEARRRLALAREARILLWVGNFLPVKNPLLAVAAAQRILRRMEAPFYLVMLGDGPLASAIAERARQMRVPLILAGRRSETDTAEFMRAADTLCLTSHAEGTPNVVLEALACGLPVAATAVGGVPEIITTPAAGRLVPPDDAEALAKAVLEIWANPVSPQRVAETVQGLAWETTVQKYRQTMAEAVGK